MVRKPKSASMALYKHIVELKDVDACYRFFSDLCSVNELDSFEQRFDVALLLMEGKVYKEIAEETGASSATISRVNRALRYGEDGLLDVINHVKLAEGGNDCPAEDKKNL